MKLKKEINELVKDFPEFQTVVLWRFDFKDFEFCKTQGLVDAESYDEYIARLDNTREEVEKLGIKITYYEGSPSVMLEFLTLNNLENNAQNRSYAIAILAQNEF